MIVNTNINALIAGNALYAASAAVAKSSERISTGLRVNSAKDDPAGLGMANRFKAQVAAYSKATDNINLGIAAVQTADGALTEIATLLTTMRTVALSSSTGTTSAATRTSNQTLLESYRDEIDTIANSATFNGVSLLNGDTTTIGTRTPRRVKEKGVLPQPTHGSPSGETTPVTGGGTWSAKPPCSSHVKSSTVEFHSGPARTAS